MGRVKNGFGPEALLSPYVEPFRGQRSGLNSP